MYEAAIDTALRGWKDAEEAGDWASLDRMSAADFAMVGPVGFLLGKDEWLARYQSGALVTTALDYSTDLIRTRSGFAIAIGAVEMQATHEGRPAGGSFRSTHVLEEISGAVVASRDPFQPAPPCRSADGGAVMTLSARGTRGNSIGALDRALTRIVTGGHWRLLRVSGYRFIPRMGGNTVLTMTTVGRRSGKPRVHPVIGVQDGDNWYVVGSNGGAADHPAWALNLLADPIARVAGPDGETRFRAELLSGIQREAVWKTLQTAYKTYTSLRRNTDRELPIFRLSRIQPEEDVS